MLKLGSAAAALVVGLAASTGAYAETAQATDTATSNASANGSARASASGAAISHVGNLTNTNTIRVGGQSVVVGGTTTNISVDPPANAADPPATSARAADPPSYPKQAPSVLAPGLPAAGIESCNSGVSLGGSAAAGGLAFGFPIQDSSCNRRLDARTLWSMGLHDAAIQTLCLDGEMAMALTATGTRCVIGPAAAASARPGVAGNAPAAGDVYEDKHGRRYVAVPCSQPHVKQAADGACLVRE